MDLEEWILKESENINVESSFWVALITYDTIQSEFDLPLFPHYALMCIEDKKPLFWIYLTWSFGFELQFTLLLKLSSACEF